MSFSEEQQKQYTEKLMVAQSFSDWNVASHLVDRARKEMQETGRTFDIAHQQALSVKSDREIITDGLLFRGLVWTSSFSDYAHKRLYTMSECIPPFIKVSCTDEQSGWEGFPVPFFTLRQNGFNDYHVEYMKNWFVNFAQGRRHISCPIIYAQNGRFGQLRYLHDVYARRGQVVTNDGESKKVLLDNDFSYCMRYIAKNWWYYPASKA